MTQEALKLALEALNDLAAWNDGEVGGHMDEPYSAEVARRTITAIKQALAQEQEPVEKFCDANCVWTDHHPDCKLVQPEQAPVAFPPVQFERVAEGIEVGYDFLGGVDIRLGGEFVYVHINYDYRYTHNAGRKALADQIVGLLTTPPQRTEQESVADDFFRMIADRNPKPFPPPQRTWVGLTDEDIKSVRQTFPSGSIEDLHSFARAVLDKSKEKNYGF
jgi:hypothetical protein